MNTVILIRVTEYGERTVVERVKVLSIRDSGYLVVVPFKEAGFYSGLEAGEHLVLADAVDIGRVRVRSRMARVRWRVDVVAAVLRHLQVP